MWWLSRSPPPPDTELRFRARSSAGGLITFSGAFAFSCEAPGPPCRMLAGVLVDVDISSGPAGIPDVSCSASCSPPVLADEGWIRPSFPACRRKARSWDLPFPSGFGSAAEPLAFSSSDDSLSPPRSVNSSERRLFQAGRRNRSKVRGNLGRSSTHRESTGPWRAD